MGVNKVVFGAVSIMDISDSTVTPETLGEGVTAYDKSGEKITGTMKSGIDTSDATATAEELASNATAYVNGEKITGTAKRVYGSYSKTVVPTYTTVAGGAVKLIQMTDTIAEPTFFGTTGATGLTFQAETSAFGDATAEDVVAGKTFTSATGLKASGTFSLDTELSEQDNLISQIQTALQGKAGGGSGGGVNIKTCTVTVVNNSNDTVYVAVTRFVNGEITDSDWNANVADGDSKTYDNVICGSGLGIFAMQAFDGVEDPSGIYPIESQYGETNVKSGTGGSLYSYYANIYKAPTTAGASVTFTVS